MTELHRLLKSLRRPRLLIRAARFGLLSYRRDRDLRRMLRAEKLPAPGRAVSRLIDVEEALEDQRKTGDATYSVARHVEVLIALMAEAQMLRARRPT